jgi:class 3 adenylate cyclase
MERFVVLFDICSSTRILENVTQYGQLDSYRDTLLKFDGIARSQTERFGGEFYKFLGDGYLVMFQGTLRADTILLFIISMYINSKQLLQNLVEHHVSLDNLQRIGLTFGVDFGNVYQIELGKSVEYYGIPINIATRLQSLIPHIEDNYKALVSLTFKNKLRDDTMIRLCSRTRRTLKNINNNEPLKCFEFDPTVVDNPRLERFPRERRDTLERFLESEEGHTSLRQLREMAENNAFSGFG